MSHSKKSHRRPGRGMIVSIGIAILVLLMAGFLIGCPAPTPPTPPTLSAHLLWQDENGMDCSQEVRNFELIDAPDGALIQFKDGVYASSSTKYVLKGWPEVITQESQVIQGDDKGFTEAKSFTEAIIIDHLLVGALIAFHGYHCPTAVIEPNEFQIYLPMGPTVVTAELEVTTDSGQFVLLFHGPAYGDNEPEDGPYTLSTSVQGSGSITPVGGEYDAGTVVSVTATPSSGWSFNHWTVNGTQGSSNVLAQITMDSDVSLIAVFTQNDPTPPPVSVAVVEFTRSGSTGTMRINPGTASLRAITANDSAQYLPANATFADISGIGVEIVNIPSPYWYIREVSSGTMTANAWSTAIQLDGNGTDSAGYVKTLAIGNWTGGRAIPFYTIASVPGRIFSLNTGANSGTLNGTALGVDVIGYIWP